MTLTNMARKRTRRIGRRLVLLGLVALAAQAFFTTQEAFAQRTTAVIQVEVTAGTAAAPAGVRVTALNTATGVTTTATDRGDGSHVLTGLAPGEYLITATPPSGKEVYRLVQAGVGQDLSLGLDIGQAVEETAAAGETIIIEGRVSESSTSEIATNVTLDQIQKLPQNNRNFLNFAALAPGVRLNQDEFRQELIGGALRASQTNVFIDGISLKSQVLQGGIVGQDSSRGNPFPQLAVGGFRVITQNYKAEYEQAGSAIITSITRSGGNEYHGDVFTSFQHEALTATDYFVEKRGDPEPDLARYQLGAAAGGPIVEDKLFVFLTYEGNYQDRQNQVFLGGDMSAENQESFGEYEGTFTSPFREHLGFGKFTWRPVDNQNIDISGSLRLETDIRSFGGTTSLENAENVRNSVVMSSVRHQWWLGSVLNEATFQFLENHFKPEAENPDLIGQEFLTGPEGSPVLIRIGGRDTDQDIGQRTFTLRDDVTFSDIEAGGQHVIKTGAKVSFQQYNVDKDIFGNPLFRYFEDPSLGLSDAFPAEARYGVGDTLVDATNTQFGLYVQDDWQIGKRLTLNLGVRWDVETNMLNNDYQTPDDLVEALTVTPGMDGMTFVDRLAAANGDDWFDVDNYITDGSDRPIYWGQIQPRIGFAFDILGDRNTILFGGAGRYYDRQLFNTAADEAYRLQHEERTFRFSADGMPRNGQPTIVWNDAYLSKEGLDTIIDSGIAPGPEVFLLENDTKPLRSDQFSGGVRQQLGPINSTVSVTHIRSENGMGFYPINRVAEPDADNNRPFLESPVGYANVLVSADDRQARYTSVQLQLEKPLNYEMSGGGVSWGATLAYTLAWAKDRGQDFNFDFPTIEDSPLESTDTDERHRLVLGGIVGLPLDFTVSTLVTLGTGLPYTLFDSSSGVFEFRRNQGRDDKFLEFRQVDLRLAKDFGLFEGHRIGAYVECFNVFDSWNFGGYDGGIPAPGADPNPNFGRPTRLVGIPRSFQLGMAYTF